MGFSLKLLIGVTVFYLVLAIVLGLIGQSELEQINYASSVDDINISSNDNIGLSSLPSFFAGLSFTISSLPGWLATILGIMGPLLIFLGIAGYIRGL